MDLVLVHGVIFARKHTVRCKSRIGLGSLSPFHLDIVRPPYCGTFPAYHTTATLEAPVLRHGLLCLFVILWRYSRQRSRTSAACLFIHCSAISKEVTKKRFRSITDG